MLPIENGERLALHTWAIRKEAVPFATIRHVLIDEKPCSRARLTRKWNEPWKWIVSSRIAARVEWGALALGGLVCAGVIFIPSGWAVVPEWIAPVEVTFAVSTLTVAVLCSRRLWLWIGRRSLAISFVPNALAALLVWSTGDEIALRLRSPPSEGFLYSSGWMCSTNVDGVFLSAITNDRIYVLQDYCIPDGPEGVRVYRRHGSSLLMQKLDLASDWAEICEAWQSSRRWLSPPRFSRSLIDTCEVRR